MEYNSNLTINKTVNKNICIIIAVHRVVYCLKMFLRWGMWVMGLLLSYIPVLHTLHGSIFKNYLQSFTCMWTTLQDGLAFSMFLYLIHWHTFGHGDYTLVYKQFIFICLNFVTYSFSVQWIYDWNSYLVNDMHVAGKCNFSKYKKMWKRNTSTCILHSFFSLNFYFHSTSTGVLNYL